MKVYMVTSGDYSDYGVDAIFSTKERAQAFIERYPHLSCNGIEEMVLDPASWHHDGKQAYEVHLTRDGDVALCHQITDVERYDSDEFEELSGRPVYGYLYQPSKIFPTRPEMQNNPDVYVTRMWARDTEHAIKIANERKAQFIALGYWK